MVPLRRISVRTALILFAGIASGLLLIATPAASEVPGPVRRYAPRVWLHSDEPYRPMDARTFVAQSRLR